MSLQLSPILAGFWYWFWYFTITGLVMVALIGVLIYLRKQNED